MHRRLEGELLSLDTELERTFRNLKKVRVAEAATMVEHIEGNRDILVVVTDKPPQR